MGRAEVGVDVGGVETAAPAIRKKMCATSGVVDEVGLSGLLGHFVVPLRDRIGNNRGQRRRY